MITSDPETSPLPAWLESLTRAEADIAGGRVVKGAAIQAILRDSIARTKQRASVTQADPG